MLKKIFFCFCALYLTTSFAAGIKEILNSGALGKICINTKKCYLSITLNGPGIEGLGISYIPESDIEAVSKSLNEPNGQVGELTQICAYDNGRRDNRNFVIADLSERIVKNKLIVENKLEKQFPYLINLNLNHNNDHIIPKKPSNQCGGVSVAQNNPNFNYVGDNLRVVVIDPKTWAISEYSSKTTSVNPQRHEFSFEDVKNADFGSIVLTEDGTFKGFVQPCPSGKCVKYIMDGFKLSME